MESSHTATNSDSEQFVRLCLYSRWDSDARTQVRALIAAGDLDWTSVCAVAAESRVSPLLYQALCEQSAVPSAVRESLRKAYDYTARYNLFLFGELQRALQALTQVGVPVIVLKGAALAKVVYQNAALRPLRDLDLLVPRGEVVRAETKLKELGYSEHRVEPQPGAALEYESQMLFFKTAPLLSQIEIHWNLIDSPFYQHKLSTDWFWQTAVPFSLGNVNALMLGPEAQILHLCAHLLLHHGGDDLLWLNDIAETLPTYQDHLNWDTLLQRAEEFGLVAPTRTILFQVASEWRTPIPAKILDRLSKLSVAKKEIDVMRWMTASTRTSAQRLWADVMTIPGWQQKMIFVWVHLFPSKDYMQRRYSITDSWLLPFYYPYRWWLGAHRAVRKKQ